MLQLTNFKGYKPDSEVSLQCDQDYHFEDDKDSKERMLKCNGEGEWVLQGEETNWDKSVPCVREYSCLLYCMSVWCNRSS